MKCKYCEKEIATEADYNSIPEGEGQHLCWSDFGQICIDADDALDIARARLEELQEVYNLDTNFYKGELSEIAKAIHYPECWDTSVYPTLLHAVEEIGCSMPEDQCFHKKPNKGEYDA